MGDKNKIIIVLVEDILLMIQEILKLKTRTISSIFLLLLKITIIKLPVILFAAVTVVVDCTFNWDMCLAVNWKLKKYWNPPENLQFEWLFEIWKMKKIKNKILTYYCCLFSF